MRSAIRALPDGRYSFEDVLDNDGIVDQPLTVALDLTIAGDRMELDFSRSSPHLPRGRSTSRYADHRSPPAMPR